jgi:hypothetical protein
MKAQSVRDEVTDTREDLLNAKMAMKKNNSK